MSFQRLDAHIHHDKPKGLEADIFCPSCPKAALIQDLDVVKSSFPGLEVPIESALDMQMPDTMQDL